MKLFPVIIFAFNRPLAVKANIESLLKNPESSETDLYIFIDGPRNESDTSKVGSVKHYANKIAGFKSISIRTSNENKGLGNSIITGVTEVINRHGAAIVVEDDLILQPNFLKFMNQGLRKYKDSKDVFSICGYTNKIKIPKDYNHDAYFCTRSSSWGWATWKDRWESVDWDLEPWNRFITHRKNFNKWGGSDCFSMLESWKNGLNKSWAIRFCFSQYLQNRLSLFPVKSLVINDGFDGNGTNCKKWSRFNYELFHEDIVNFKLPEKIEIHPKLFSSAIRYHSILRRILSKIMYIIYK